MTHKSYKEKVLIVDLIHKVQNVSLAQKQVLKRKVSMKKLIIMNEKLKKETKNIVKVLYKRFFQKCINEMD
jgi:hypothetical protein